jgi:FkbH-like protein
MTSLKDLSYDEIIKESLKVKKKSTKEIKIYVLSNFTFDTIKPCLKFFLNNYDINTKIIINNFNQIDQTLFKIKSNKELLNSDFIVIAMDSNYFLDSFDNGNYKKNRSNFKNFEYRVINWINSIQKYGRSKIIFWNVALDYYQYYGLKIKSTQYILSEKYNSLLIKLAKIYKNFYIFDIEKISNFIGYKNFYDERLFFLAQIPISIEGQKLIAFECSRLISSIIKVKKKCLVLDLDNTLWHGVVGEDGIEGIKIGENFIGNQFKKFQKYLKNLKDKGTLLSICSKNNYEDALNAFINKPEMILKINDFVSLKINWNKKNENIKEIAKELNIGLDSIVFFDDSEMERMLIKKTLPEVNLINVPKDPSLYIEALEESGYFDDLKNTKEDFNKTKKYKIIEKYKKFKSKFFDESEFLKELKMTAVISSIKKNNFDRCLQMTNKVNQFNLTTKRYDEQKLFDFIKKNCVSSVIKVMDRFGDYGITGLAIAKRENQQIWKIDTFLMSCRIIGRNIENVLISDLIDKIKKKNGIFIIGKYYKTKNNILCKDLLKNFNFSKEKDYWKLNIYKANIPKTNIKIKYE